MSVFELDPESLRARADRHEQAAERTRRWARKPDEWLSTFIHNYGKVAQPVYESLKRHFDNRERAGNSVADQHMRTARWLRAAADSFERADGEYGTYIDESGDRFGDLSPAPGGGPVPILPHSAGVSPGQRVTTPLNGGVPAAGGPRGGNPLVDSPAPGAAPRSDVPTTPGPEVPVGTGAGPAPGGAPVVASAASAMGLPGRDGPPGAGGQGGVTPPAAGCNAASSTVANPIARALGTARRRAAAESEVIDDDLLVARTLLSTVLAAAGATPNAVSWAVAVLRSASGAGVFITTGEGRGWLPPGLFLPREVSTPWLWDELLGTGAGSPSRQWEELSDPARILVEFAGVWGPKAAAHLTALAVSDRIPPDILARIPAVATEEMVTAAAPVDLGVPASGTVDRLSLSGSIDALEHVATVARVGRAAHCLELALEAHDRMRRSGPAVPELVHSVRLRGLILELLEKGRQPPEQLWEEFRSAMAPAVSPLVSQRHVVSAPDDSRAANTLDAKIERARRHQCWCSELVMLLEGGAGYQQLRDAVFIYEQIVRYVPARGGGPEVSVVVGSPERAAALPRGQWPSGMDPSSYDPVTRSARPDSVTAKEAR